MARYFKQKNILYKDCFFCESDKEPSYQEPQDLQRFISERGKILARIRVGTCSRHHRALTREIKRARFLALLPYIVRG